MKKEKEMMTFNLSNSILIWVELRKPIPKALALMQYCSIPPNVYWNWCWNLISMLLIATAVIVAAINASAIAFDFHLFRFFIHLFVLSYLEHSPGQWRGHTQEIEVQITKTHSVKNHNIVIVRICEMVFNGWTMPTINST